MRFPKFILKSLLWAGAILVGFFLLSALLVLQDIPGYNRFRRYCSYGNVQEMMAVETNDIRKVVAFQQDGSNFTAVVVAPCRYWASGPAVLIYNQEGRLIDSNRDIGDYCYRSGRGRKDWKFTPWYSQTEVKLRKMQIPEIFPAAPTTMGELAAFLQQATIDFGDPALAKEKRGVMFVCSDDAARKVFPERSKSAQPLSESLSSTNVSIWDALQNGCREIGCVAEVENGVVTIRVKPR